MDTPCLTRTYRSHHLDSERWDHVTLRPGDVVISTSMKAGTTWMQRIMSLLVFGPGPLPAPLVALSPWIDAAFLGDVDDVVATIEAQEHQRFLKSHLPFDALPYDRAVRYVYVGRDTGTCSCRPSTTTAPTPSSPTRCWTPPAAQAARCHGARPLSESCGPIG